MAVATVTLRPSLPMASYVEGKYVCDASPSLTYIDVGFVPSRVEILNATDGDVYTVWTRDMADGKALCITTAAALIASGAVTPVPPTNTSHCGFTVGTDASVQEASKTFSFIAFR